MKISRGLPLLLAALTVLYPAAAQPKPAISIVIRLASNPAMVEVTLTNTSGHEINFTRDVYKLFYVVDIRDQNGVWAHDKQPGFVHGQFDMAIFSRLDPSDQTKALRTITNHPVDVHLKPGQTLVETVNVANIYDLTIPGEYSLHFEGPDPEGHFPVKSNTIKLTIAK